MSRVMVFIASRTEQENYILQKKLEILRQEFPILHFSGVHPMGLPINIDRNTGLVILNVANWSAQDTTILRDVGQVGYRGPLLALMKDDAPPSIPQSLVQRENLIFLQKPVDPRNLNNVVRKMLTARSVKQQKHRRFTCGQEAEVESLDKAMKTHMRVRNLSKTGAFVEYNSPVPVRVGDSVNVKFELSQLSRTYLMLAKVVWIQSPKNAGFPGGMGLQFLNGDMKRVVLSA